MRFANRLLCFRRNRLSTGFAVLALSLSGLLHAAHEAEEPDSQGAAELPDKPDRIVVPEYQSPLQSFMGHEYASPPEWRRANDRVGEIGGWRAYAREAFEQESEENEQKDGASR